MSETDPHSARRRGLLGSLRASFLTGLIVVMPVGLTIYLIWTVVGWIDDFVLPFVPAAYQPDALLRALFGPDYDYSVRGLGVVIFLAFTIVVGWAAKGLFGRSFIRFAEGLVDRMPVVRSIYNGLKQIAETVFAQSGTSFDRACLIEYPRKGIWAIGFISSSAKGEIARRVPHDQEILSVFLPTTPNPTSGFLLFIPATETIILDMKVEDAAKLIISAGLVYPNPKDPTRPLTAGQA